MREQVLAHCDGGNEFVASRGLNVDTQSAGYRAAAGTTSSCYVIRTGFPWDGDRGRQRCCSAEEGLAEGGWGKGRNHEKNKLCYIGEFKFGN